MAGSAGFRGNVAGVQAHLADLTLTETSRPPVAVVEEWLTVVTHEVLGAMAGVDALPAALAGELDETARGLVHLGVAAWVIDAAYPERADPGDTGLAGALEARYLRGLAALAGRVKLELGRVDLPYTPAAVPLFSFPPAIVTRRRGW